MKKLINKIKNMSKKKKIILSICIVLIITAIVIACILLKPEEVIKKTKKKKVVEPEPTITIFDLNSKTRPVAVMINNHNQARPYHSGLQNAQVVYELIVEGGITRMLAVFKDQSLDRIGPVRSARHNYLDYAMEHDAIYVHWGWSPQAESDIANLGVNNLNGLYDSGFSRDQSLIGKINLEHTAITSSEGINNAIAKKGYRTEYNTDNVEDALVFKYSAKEINLNAENEAKQKEKEEAEAKAEKTKKNTKETTTENEDTEEIETDVMVANNVTVPYSNYMTASYTYDATNKYYLRFANGVEHKDYITGEQYHFKNIIIQKVENYTMDDYGRQNLNTVGTGTGYFITNGYARPITWEKASRSSKTVYKFNDGKEITLNDGNTFVQIEPINMTPSITE